MNIIAKDIMSTEILSVREGTSIEDALKVLVNSRITGLPVVDPEGKMIGIFSDYDVISQLGERSELDHHEFQKPIRYSANIQAVDEKTSLQEIIQYFVGSRFRRLPVLNAEGKLVGIITRRDLMKLFYYRMKLS